MTVPNTPFTDNPQKLARNPLGIIAMFLLLVYGVAGLAFGVTAHALLPSERLPIIWFLVTFPVLILATFAWLVSRHHPKLYAPGDFQDPEGFFRAMTVPEQKRRLDQEVEEARAAISHPQKGTEPQLPPDRIRSNVVLAEELAFKAIEAEFGRPILRHVSTGHDRGYDGVFRMPDGEVAVEIKYSIASTNWSRFADHAVALASSFSGRGRAVPITVLLVVVADRITSEDRVNAQRLLERRLAQLAAPIKLRVFDFQSLKAEFGIGG